MKIDRNFAFRILFIVLHISGASPPSSAGSPPSSAASGCGAAEPGAPPQPCGVPSSPSAPPAELSPSSLPSGGGHGGGLHPEDGQHSVWQLHVSLAAVVFAVSSAGSESLAGPDSLSIGLTHAISQCSAGGHSPVHFRIGQLHCPVTTDAEVVEAAKVYAQQIARATKIIVTNFMFASKYSSKFQMLQSTDIVSDKRQVFYTDFKYIHQSPLEMALTSYSAFYVILSTSKHMSENWKIFT